MKSRSNTNRFNNLQNKFVGEVNGVRGRTGLRVSQVDGTVLFEVLLLLKQFPPGVLQWSI